MQQMKKIETEQLKITDRSFIFNKGPNHLVSTYNHKFFHLEVQK